MKYLSVLIVCMALLSCNNNTVIESGEQEASIETPTPDSREVKGTNLDKIATETDPIKDIQQKYKAINTAKENGELMMDSIVYECPDYPSYGIVYYYKKDDKIRMIKHSYDDGSHGGRSIEYYLWDNELFFQYVDESYWTFGGGGNVDGDEFQPNTIDYFTEMRYYFKDNELIRCLEKKFEYRTANKKNPKSNEVSNKEIECKEAELLLMAFYELRDLDGKDITEGTCIFELKDEQD